MPGLASYMTGGAIVGIGLSALVGVTAEKLRGTERFLALKELKYVDGQFYQEHIVNPSGLHATWRARIQRGEEQVCPTAGGPGAYTPQPRVMSIDFWAGEGCEAKLEVGQKYTAIAVWEYLNDAGQAVTVLGETEFIYTGPP